MKTNKPLTEDPRPKQCKSEYNKQVYRAMTPEQKAAYIARVAKNRDARMKSNRK